MNPIDLRLIEKCLEEFFKMKAVFDFEKETVLYTGKIDTDCYLKVEIFPGFIEVGVQVEGIERHKFEAVTYSTFCRIIKDLLY